MTDLNELENRLLGIYNFTLSKETILKNIEPRLEENGWIIDKEKPFIDENRKPTSELVNGSRTKLNLYCNKKDKWGLMHGSFYIGYGMFMSGRGCPDCSNRPKYTPKEKALKRIKIQLGWDKFKNLELDYKNPIIQDNPNTNMVDMINDRVNLRCNIPKHGKYQPTLSSFLNREFGCPKCGKKNLREETTFKKRRRN